MWYDKIVQGGVTLFYDLTMNHTKELKPAGKSLRLIQWRSTASDLEVACNLGADGLYPSHTPHTHQRAGRDPVQELAGVGEVIHIYTQYSYTICEEFPLFQHKINEKK